MLNIYCTYDTISEQYSQPWFAKNDNVARRNLMIASVREHLPLKDIKLYCIGCFNTEEGFVYDCKCEGINLPTIELVLPSEDEELKKE